MATITRTGAGDLADEDGERVIEMLRDMAMMANVLLPQKGGDVGRR